MLHLCYHAMRTTRSVSDIIGVSLKNADQGRPDAPFITPLQLGFPRFPYNDTVVGQPYLRVIFSGKSQVNPVLVEQYVHF